MGTARIVTDAGKAYIKALSNRQGPHPLACELVAIQLAQWFGLPTFEFSIMELLSEGAVTFLDGSLSQPGPAFVTRAAKDHQTWDGADIQLLQLENPEDITRLVVFDNWIRNWDRHSPDNRDPNLDNVFLTSEGASRGRLRLIAMDNSHCFTSGGVLTSKSFQLASIQDAGLYGLFPAFIPFIKDEQIREARDRLLAFTPAVASQFLAEIPTEWDVSKSVREAWGEFLCRRARFLADTIPQALARICWPGQLWDDRRVKKKGGRR